MQEPRELRNQEILLIHINIFSTVGIRLENIPTALISPPTVPQVVPQSAAYPPFDPYSAALAQHS